MARIGVDRLDLVWRGRQVPAGRGTARFVQARQAWRCMVCRGMVGFVPVWIGRLGEATRGTACLGGVWQAWFVVDWCGGDRHGGVRQGRHVLERHVLGR